MAVAEKRVFECVKPKKPIARTKAEAQMIADEARRILKLREQEFLRALSKHIKIKKDGFLVTIVIEIKGQEIGKMKITTFKNKKNQIYLNEISIGNYFGKSILRNLGIGSLLLRILKTWAIRYEYIGINLYCEEELVPFYEKNGFKIIPIQGFQLANLRQYNLMEWVAPKTRK